MNAHVKKMLVGTPIILIVFSLVIFVSSTESNETDIGEEKVDRLSNCLSEAEATMYGSKSCPHCQTQKDMFGRYFDRIDYVECTEKQQECKDAGISGVPQWKINGENLRGTQDFESLSEAANCDIEFSEE